MSKESEKPRMMRDRSLDDDPVEILDDDDLKMSLFRQRVTQWHSDTESVVLSMLLFCLILCSCTALSIYVSLQSQHLQ